MKYVVYTEEGKVLSIVDTPLGASGHAKCPGEFTKEIDTTFDLGSYYDLPSDTFIPLPNKPHPAFRFNYLTKSWEDPRTTKDVLDEVRSLRNHLLASSDWRVAKAIEAGEPMDAAWVSYRQALRDVTQQEDLLSITWPTAP